MRTLSGLGPDATGRRCAAVEEVGDGRRDRTLAVQARLPDAV